MRVLNCRESVDLERNCEILARKHGCVETWQLGGKEIDMMAAAEGGRGAVGGE